MSARDKSEVVHLRSHVDALEALVRTACDAIDLADNLLAVNMGIDVPNEWHKAVRKVAQVRADLPK